MTHTAADRIEALELPAPRVLGRSDDEDDLPIIGYNATQVRALLAAAAAIAREADSGWKAAVIEACVANCIEWDEADPTRTLRNLIHWETLIALDPAVSSEAQALIDRGRSEAREPAASADERAAFEAWALSLSTEDRYHFDSEGRGHKKDATILMWLAWQAAIASRAAASRPADEPPALDIHGRYWVENRGRIIDAVTAAGFRIMSTNDRCWLEPIAAARPDAGAEPKP